MGSFGVSCSISKVPLEENAKVVLVFLEDSRTYYTKEGLIPHTNLFTNADDLYRPALLPIKGTLDDYGSIDYKTDNHIIALEKYFNMPMYAIINVVTNNRKYLEYSSFMFEQFNIPKLEGVDKNFTKQSFDKIGFIEKDGVYSKEDTNLTFSYTKEKKKYNFIVKKEYIQKEYNLDDLFELQSSIFKDFNYIISVSMERQSKFVESIKKVSSFSSMYISEKIYNTMINNTFDGKKIKREKNNNLSAEPHPCLMKKIGFKEEKNSINTVKSFSKNGLVFQKIDHMTEYKNKYMNSMKDIFEICEDNNVEVNPEKIVGFNIFKEKIKYTIKRISEIPKHDDGNVQITNMMMAMEIYNLKKLITHRERWSTFIDVYSDIISKGDISFLDNLDEFYEFFYDMESLNIIFSPTLGGRQCYDTNFLKLIYKKSYSVLNTRKKDKFNETIVETYIFKNDIVNAEEELEELLEQYQIEYVMQYSGLSKFEINLFQKDKKILKEILDSY